MAEILKSINPWLLILTVILLGGWFVWSVRNIFEGFAKAVNDLRNLIEKLFDKHDDHETRLSSLEGRCDAMHGPMTGGRRPYDPKDRIK